MNRIVLNGHDRSPFAGLRDPLLQARNARILADALREVRNGGGFAGNDATLTRATWLNGGGGPAEMDPRANVAAEAGWPENPTDEQLMAMFLTDSISARVVEFMPKECYQVWPLLKDGEELEADGSPFLESWNDLGAHMLGGEENWYEPEEGHPLFADLEELSIVSGIGSYGVLFMGFDDVDSEDELRNPVEGLEELGSRPKDDKGTRDGPAVPKKADDDVPVFSANGHGGGDNYHRRYRLKVNQEVTQPEDPDRRRKLNFVQALPGTLARIAQWETNPSSPRYQKPTLYQVNQIDPNTRWEGSLPPTRTLHVHWTRIVHHCHWRHHPRPGGGRVLANSKMRCVLPELLGGRKINAADQIAHWRNAVMKFFLETHPQMGGDVLFNKSEAQDDFENMMNSPSQMWMFLRGLHANPVAPALTDPTPHQTAAIQRICIKNGWPMRIFMGSERGELASGQDVGEHKDRVKGDQYNFESPATVAPVVNRLILCGVCAPPTDKIKHEWPPIGSQDELKKAQIASARAQAFAAFEAVTLIGDQDKLVHELDYTEEEAEAVLAAAEEEIAAEEEEMMALADEQGFKPQAPDGFVDPEEEDRKVEMAKAGAGPGGPPGFPPKGAGGPPKPGAKKPPPFARNADEDEDVPWAEPVDNAFCPTGEGGGIDPTCPSGEGTGGSAGGGGERPTWKGGGGTPLARVKEALRLTQSREELWPDDDDRSFGRIMHHKTIADDADEELKGLSREKLYDTLSKAGLEGVRRGDSKSAMLVRLRNKLTAAFRSRQRNDV